MNKKYTLLILCSLILVGVACVTIFILNKEEVSVNETPKNTEVQKQEKKIESVKTEQTIKNNNDLYSSAPYDISLQSIAEINRLDDNIKRIVDKQLESSQEFYLLKISLDNTKLSMILQDGNVQNRYPRHDIKILEVLLADGSITQHNLGYQGENNEISINDVWEYDDSTEERLPLKHTNYDEFGGIKFVETWNYSDSSPIKYEMKDELDKPISVLKEIVENDTNYRKEHIFYDKDGKIDTSISVNYDGANITRFTYYNSKNPEDNLTIISEYNDGLKTEEKVYNSNYQLINTLKAEYQNGERKSIHVFDAENKELSTLTR